MRTLRKRALSQGRGSAHLAGINYQGLLTTNRPVWYCREVLKGVKYLVFLMVSHLVFPKAKRVEKVLQGYVHIGRSYEAFKLARSGRGTEV